LNGGKLNRQTPGGGGDRADLTPRQPTLAEQGGDRGQVSQHLPSSDQRPTIRTRQPARHPQQQVQGQALHPLGHTRPGEAAGEGDGAGQVLLGQADLGQQVPQLLSVRTGIRHAMERTRTV